MTIVRNTLPIKANKSSAKTGFCKMEKLIEFGNRFYLPAKKESLEGRNEIIE